MEWGSSGDRRRLTHRRMIAVSHRLSWELGKLFPRALPFVYVCGYPKSGTSWVSQLLSYCLDIPHVQQSIFPIGFPAVLQGHRPVSRRFHRSVYVIRDGRDAMVSSYFHERGLAAASTGSRNAVTADRVRAELPGFIARQVRRPFGSPLNWGEHVTGYFEMGENAMALIRYEELLRAGQSVLRNALSNIVERGVREELISAALERYSFKKQSGRNPGVEQQNSYLRKGVTGDWKEYFTPEAAAVFNEHFGQPLIVSGYEQDSGWVSRVGAGRSAA